MEDKNRNMPQTMNRDSGSMEKTAEAIGDTIVAVLDRLSGKKSDLKLSFEDLTLDTTIFKAKMNGAIILETTMAKDVQSVA
jgi:hypothetical protein